MAYQPRRLERLFSGRGARTVGSSRRRATTRSAIAGLIWPLSASPIRDRGRVLTGGELRLGAPAGGSGPHDESHRRDAGGGAHGVPAEAPGTAFFRSRGKDCGLLAKAGDDAIGDRRADLAPERIPDQVVGIPRAAQFRVRPEPS